MKSLTNSYKAKRPPAVMRSSKCSSPVLLTPNKSPTNSTCHSPTSIKRKLGSSKLVMKNKTSLEKSPDSIQSKKTSAEDNQSSPLLSTLALRLKLESRNSPRNSLKTRPDSIKPLVLKYEDERSRGNSPVNRVNSPVFDKFYLTLDEEAISRPYCESHFMVLDSKEKSYGERMAYWRQKKIQQYRIAKNIQGSKNSLPSSPRKVLSGKEKNGPGKVKGSSYEKIALGKNGPGGFCRSGKDGGGGFAHNFGEWDTGLILNRIPGFFSYSNTPISLRKNLIIKDIK